MVDRESPVALTAGESADREPILDDDSVFRRIAKPSMLYSDPVTGKVRPSSGVFRVKLGEDGLSVYREGLMKRYGLRPADLTVAPDNLLARLSVGDVRSISGLDVRDDPQPEGVSDPNHPRHKAHALIVGWHGLSSSKRKEKEKRLTQVPSLELISPLAGRDG